MDHKKCKEFTKRLKKIEKIADPNKSAQALSNLTQDMRQNGFEFPRMYRHTITVVRQLIEEYTTRVANKKWYQTNIFKGAVIALVVTLLGGGIPAWLSLCNKTNHSPTTSTNIFAYVSKDGTILRSKNFPWKITKTKHHDGNIIYIINDRRGDSTAISVFPDNSTKKYFVRNAYDGMAIIFTCTEEEISNFTIEVKY